MKTLSLLGILFMLTNFSGITDVAAQSIKADLQSISYYAKSSDCTSDNMILVRVKFKVNKAPADLLMTYQYSNGARISRNIEKIDKIGNIVYDFCVKEDYKEEIISVFKTESGETSELIIIAIDTQNATIISGTPPQALDI